MSLKKLLLALVGVSLVGVLVLGILAWFVVPRWIERELVAAAEARGVALSPGKISFGLGWVQITDSNATLIGVRGLSAQVGLLDVQLKGLQPERVSVGKVKVSAVADPLALARELTNWHGAHAAALVEPVSITPLEFELLPKAQAAPVLKLAQGSFEYLPPGFTLRAKQTSLLGRDLGALKAELTERGVSLGVTLAKSAPENPALAIELGNPPKPTLHIALAPTTVAELGSLTGINLPLPSVLLSGTVDTALPANGSILAGIEGDANFTLGGYVPPHPLELDGFVFGDATRVASHFVVEPARLRVRLERASLTAGAFALKGEGQLALAELGPRLTLTLSGNLPCAALAGAAAESRLGAALGKLGGKAAHTTLNGSVNVQVNIQADLLDVAHTRVHKTITPGCGLKPLTLAELTALGDLLPQALDPNVAADLEKLMKTPLPALPTLPPDTQLNLPKLPKLPPFTLPLVPSSEGGGASPTPTPKTTEKTAKPAASSASP